MGLAEIALATVPSTALGAAVTGLFMRRKTRAEADKLDDEGDKARAESGKIEAESEAVSVATALSVVVLMREENTRILSRLKDVEDRTTTLEGELTQATSALRYVTGILRIAIDFIDQLLAWIENHAPGQSPPPTPPELKAALEGDEFTFARGL
ncbi:hypothetical protein C8K38_111189 [Rhodococcus sp. OK611]|uniref:hypothetical protein n=1 Tax=unclassified Rhodococcus (in: high G+C Gram-positive bacteria) TaxID=192944 RepID=UPI000BD49A2E|nr:MULTISPECIES: hypothetical protein [unclassified Rhodococcus (in: high G+C Gram-positive bacteria)]PTR42020.1 hypothetical protein C8K38_111189 [Rhodococcus sp. OK611]SNX91533.1 hypothetical protein SAMN05447004_11068 [Rhodococcus sp. OK270]